MPERVECGNVVLQNGSGAASTFRSEHVKVVLPAIRLTIFLMETYPEEDQGLLRDVQTDCVQLVWFFSIDYHRSFVTIIIH